MARSTALFSWRAPLLLICWLTLLPALNAAQPCGSVTLAWDENRGDSALAGYVVYYGLAPGHYTGQTNVMLRTSVTLSNLVQGLTYYFAVTAYNTSGIESDPSGEISYRIPLCDCHIANVGDLLVITNVPAGPRLSRRLTFGVSGPFGTSPWIHPTNGIFAWRPPLQFASTTQYFDVTVTDNGTPPVTQTQTLCVAVNDYVMIELGTVAVRTGQNTNVLLRMFSTASVTNLCVTIEYPHARLANLSLSEPSPLICSAAITPVSSNRVQACFQACPGLVLLQGETIAQLNFITLPGNSAFAPLRLVDATAIRDDSRPIHHISRRDGRGVVIGNQPLLDIARGANGSLWLTLFGKPGATYKVLCAADALSPDWRLLDTIPLQGLFQQLRLTNSLGNVSVLVAEETGNPEPF